MAQAQTKRDGCGLEGGPGRGEIQESHPSKEAGTSCITWLLQLLYFRKAKYFLLYESQYKVCVQMLQLPCGPWRINYTWGDWSWKVSGTIRVKQQDRVQGVEQEVWQWHLQRGSRNTCFREFTRHLLSSESSKRNLGILPRNRSSIEVRMGWFKRCLKGRGWPGSWWCRCTLHSNTKIQNLMPYSTPFSPQERGGVKKMASRQLDTSLYTLLDRAQIPWLLAHNKIL